MKLNKLSTEAAEGLLRWALYQHGDELFFDGIGGPPSEWAWIYFQLYVAEDRAEWFPKGKSATIQVIEADLLKEAGQERKKIDSR